MNHTNFDVWPKLKKAKIYFCLPSLYIENGETNDNYETSLFLSLDTSDVI